MCLSEPTHSTQTLRSNSVLDIRRGNAITNVLGGAVSGVQFNDALAEMEEMEEHIQELQERQEKHD